MGKVLLWYFVIRKLFGQMNLAVEVLELPEQQYTWKQDFSCYKSSVNIYSSSSAATGGNGRLEAMFSGLVLVLCNIVIF